VPKTRLPGIVRDHLEKALAAALAAVEAYNKPGSNFRTAHYIVMITIAWTALFHAIFFETGRRPWYRKKTSGKGKGIRYIYVDGDPKHWELAECIKEYFADKHPSERMNLTFIAGLRHKIEHRHLIEPLWTLEAAAAIIPMSNPAALRMFMSRHKDELPPPRYRGHGRHFERRYLSSSEIKLIRDLLSSPKSRHTKRYSKTNPTAKVALGAYKRLLDTA